MTFGESRISAKMTSVCRPMHVKRGVAEAAARPSLDAHATMSARTTTARSCRTRRRWPRVESQRARLAWKGASVDCSRSCNMLVTPARDDRVESEVIMPDQPTVDDLEMLNDLVQDGLIEVVSIDAAGVPSYQIASRFRNAALGLERQPEARADQSSLGGSSA
jgi:hypothetical protein